MITASMNCCRSGDEGNGVVRRRTGRLGFVIGPAKLPSSAVSVIGRIARPATALCSVFSSLGATAEEAPEGSEREALANVSRC